MVRIGITVVALIILAIAVFDSFYTVTAGERGIVFRFGQVNAVVPDGPHFKMPMVDTVQLVDVRTKSAKSPATAGTKDLQTVSTEVALNYKLDPEKLADTYTRVGLDVEAKIVDPRIQEIVKAVVAKFSAEELLIRREDVKSEIVIGLRTSLKQYNILVEDIQITNFAFSQAFDQSIEAKQTAEQNALKAKNDLDRIKIEAEQKVTMAEAEAKTIQIQAQAIQVQGGAAYVQMKAIEKWDGKLPQVSGGGTPFIQLPAAAGNTK